MYSILLKNISFSRQALRVPNISETPLRRFSCHPTSTCSTETFKRTENSLLSSQLEFVRNELKRWDPSQPITKSPTPPSTWYTDPSFFKAESNTVFRKNWLQVGRVDQLKESGDYVSGSIMGEPYVVLRDTNGELKAFYNVCRHHASRILQNGEGKLKEQQLVCPYHGWTYTLEGKLKRATQIKGIEDFKASNYGLKPMKVTTFGPWVFIKTDINDNSWDLNEELKPLSDMLEETNYKNLKWISQSSYTVNCNWKVYIDNYCDGGYHIPYLHKSLDTQIDMKSYDTKIFNKFSVQIAHGKESEDQYIKSRIGNTGAYYAYLYPNFMINRYGDTMDTNLVVPLSHDKTLVYFDYFYKTNVGPEYEDFVKKSVQISDEIQREDEFISEMVQQGLSSDGFDVGRYAPKIETAAYHFHQILYNDLK